MTAIAPCFYAYPSDKKQKFVFLNPIFSVLDLYFRLVSIVLPTVRDNRDH